MQLNDTIAAISSAVGPAARMIVRASGPQSRDYLQSLCPDFPGTSGAARTSLRCNGMSIPAWVYRFAGGRSYTGDDLFELHIPGNPLLAAIILRRLISLGARSAEPGEFTARAYFNGRIDLSQAEGVAAVVSAANQAELDAGRRLMAGELSRRLRPVLDQLSQTLALIEAEIDFSDQEVRFLSADQVSRRLSEAERELYNLLNSSARLSRLSHEPRLVLAGRPNAGKSTLLNVLSQSARAVVSPVAGTTRDALCAPVALDRGIIRLVDVAGLDEVVSGDEIEARMRSHALRELESADAVILVRDASDARPPLKLPRTTDLVVMTKIDLLPGFSAVENQVGVSATENIGMDNLRRRLDALAFGQTRGNAELALTTRHVGAIQAAVDSVQLAIQSGAAELIAAELRQALDSLGQVLGDVSPDDILGRIFSTFCIGK